MNTITDSEQRQIFSENLQRLIGQSGKDQKDIAFDIGENPPTFNQWVKGKALPKVSTIKKIASYFNADVLDLINRAPDKNETQFRGISGDEIILLNAYRSASDEIKDAVRGVLKIRG